MEASLNQSLCKKEKCQSLAVYEIQSIHTKDNIPILFFSVHVFCAYMSESIGVHWPPPPVSMKQIAAAAAGDLTNSARQNTVEQQRRWTDRLILRPVLCAIIGVSLPRARYEGENSTEFIFFIKRYFSWKNREKFERMWQIRIRRAATGESLSNSSWWPPGACASRPQ